MRQHVLLTDLQHYNWFPWYNIFINIPNYCISGVITYDIYNNKPVFVVGRDLIILIYKSTFFAWILFIPSFRRNSAFRRIVSQENIDEMCCSLSIHLTQFCLQGAGDKSLESLLLCLSGKHISLAVLRKLNPSQTNVVKNHGLI